MEDIFILAAATSIVSTILPITSAVLYTNKQPPRENYVCEMRIRALRTKPKKRNSVPKCFVSRNMKRPGKYAGLFRETKRRQKIVFRFCCFISDVFQLWPYQWMLAAPVTPLG